jgi:hypothetical protein
MHACKLARGWGDPLIWMPGSAGAKGTDHVRPHQGVIFKFEYFCKFIEKFKIKFRL